MSDGGCNPHWTARLYLHAAARAKAVRRLIKPDKIPGKLPHGPLKRSDSLELTPGNAQLGTWYAKARSVWHSLMSSQPAASTHKFRWEAATGRKACTHMGSSSVSAELRALARKIDDAATIIEKGASPCDPRIRVCTVSNAKTCEGKKLQSPDVSLPAMQAWCAQVNKALLAGNTLLVRRLLRNVNKKASDLETKHARLR